jgi:hypothetical protein
MPIDEPEIARAHMDLAKQEYDRCKRLHRAGKVSKDQVQEACNAWNCAMSYYLESKRIWTLNTKRQQETP